MNPNIQTGGRATMQNDGNFVLYDSRGNPFWSTKTDNKGNPPYTLMLQDTGRLILVGGKGKVHWT